MNSNLLDGRADAIGRRARAVATAALLSCAVLTVPAAAQTEAPPPPAPPPSYSPAQLDQMLAPIALYPDDLLGQILMAATYPLEVVQADRWLQDPSNAALRGNDLTQALQAQSWDPSVKSLVAYPQILSWMDSGLDWTEAVGDAFLARQSDVMDSIQRLRARAQSAGTLQNTPQETVSGGDQGIAIANTDPNIEYVPVYSPQAAYGDWPYPDYPPDEFYAPGYTMGTFIAFPILFGYWGWDHWDWHHHRIDVDPGVGPGFRPGSTGGRRPPHHWEHDPGHRGGVPYRDPGTRARFEGPGDSRSAQSNFRGFPPGPARPTRQITMGTPARQPVVAGEPPRSAGPPSAATLRQPPPAPVRQPAPIAQAPSFQQPAPQPQNFRPAPPPAAPRPAPVQHAMPPAMESFGRGEQVHIQEQRGAASRVESAPARSGGGGGGHR